MTQRDEQLSDDFDEQVARFTEYIGKVRWRYARTMPQCPHEYTVRWDRPDLDDDFCDFARFIRKFGYKQKFYSRPGLYFDIGEHKYWTMGSPILGPRQCPRDQNTYILNRASKHDVYGDQR